MRKLYLLSLGFAVGILGLVVAPLTRATNASACSIGTKCTYYENNNNIDPGACGIYDPTQTCVCTYAGHSQDQTACGAPPA